MQVRRLTAVLIAIGAIGATSAIAVPTHADAATTPEAPRPKAALSSTRPKAALSSARPKAAILADRPGRLHVDFNNDGYEDLVVPAAGESAGAVTHAGAVTIMYGSAGGLTAAGATTFTQDTPGVPGTAEKEDWFGIAHAEGDFNADGYTDVAIGSQETLGAQTYAGSVTVLFGSASGITAAGAQLFTASTSGFGPSNTHAFFGGGLGAGDVNGDAVDDLAVSAPGATVQGQVSAGALTLLKGSGSGLVASNQVLSQNSPGIHDRAEASDFWGIVNAVGDLNHDGRADIVVGDPYEDQGAANSGMVDIIYGQPGGLTPAADRQYYGPSTKNGYFGANVVMDAAASRLVAYAPSPSFDGYLFNLNRLQANSFSFRMQGPTGSQAGLSMQFGNFDGIASNVIAVGEPSYNNFGGGRVMVARPSSRTWTTLAQGVNGVPGRSERADDFGWTMVVRDFNHDGYDDLAVGVPFEDVGTRVDAGDFYVFYGRSTGMSTVGVQLWSQDSPGIPGISETDDEFGSL